MMSEQQYHTTNASAARLEAALAQAEEGAEGRAPLLQRAMRAAVETELHERYRAMAAYEKAHPTAATEAARVRSADVAWSLIRARIMADVSQAELARRLDVSEEEIRRLGATGFTGATLALVQQIVTALGVRIEISMPAA